MGGGAHAGGAAVGLGEHGFDLRGGKSSVAALHERADDAAAHLVEKAVAADDDGDILAAAFYIAAGEGAHGAFHFVGMIGGKGFEVVFADEQFRGGFHLGEIDRARNVPRAPGEQRVHGVVVPDVIAIFFAARMEAGVEFGGGAFRVQHADVFRQKGVQRDAKARDGQLVFRLGYLKVRDHAERVHAGVGAAGAVEAGLAGEIAGEHGFDFFLHANADLLHLPALVSRAVVGDGEFEFNWGQHF